MTSLNHLFTSEESFTVTLSSEKFSLRYFIPSEESFTVTLTSEESHLS